MEYPAFVGGSYESQAVTADQERTVNFYVERMESQGATSRSALYPTPGVEAITLTLPLISESPTPTVTNQGTPGATTYGYKIVATLGPDSMHAPASTEGTTTTGNATLDGTNFNRLTWAAVTNASRYTVYRTTGGDSPPKRLANITALTYDDTGTAGTAETPVTTNTTGIAHTPDGPGRAHFFLDGLEFMVSGVTFYEIGQFGLLTPRGEVTIGANPATISSNGDGGGELFITSGNNGYIFDLTTHLLTQVAALNGKATMGDALDGYFLALDAATSKLAISNLLDGLTWQSTQFAQRSIAPDPWISMKVVGRYIWLFGEQTSEVWYNTGASPFPFAPHPSGLVPFGIASAFSAVVMDGALAWLGASASGDGYVLRTSGFSPEVISTYPLQKAFNSYATIADAIADTYSDWGHSFYLISFPTENVTWAWDARTGIWAQRQTWIAEQNKYVAWRPRWHAMAFGEHRMLDGSTGHVYRMAPTLGSDVDGRPIRRMRRAPALTAENQRVFYSAFELDLEPGLGLLPDSAQGSNPQVMFRISNDGGKTWGAEQMRSAGKIGQYLRRVRLDRCGASRRRVFEVVVSDPIPWRLTNAFLHLAQPIPGIEESRPRRSA